MSDFPASHLGINETFLTSTTRVVVLSSFRVWKDLIPQSRMSHEMSRDTKSIPKWQDSVAAGRIAIAHRLCMCNHFAICSHCLSDSSTSIVSMCGWVRMSRVRFRDGLKAFLQRCFDRSLLRPSNLASYSWCFLIAIDNQNKIYNHES